MSENQEQKNEQSQQHQFPHEKLELILWRMYSVLEHLTKEATQGKGMLARDFETRLARVKEGLDNLNGK